MSKFLHVKISLFLLIKQFNLTWRWANGYPNHCILTKGQYSNSWLPHQWLGLLQNGKLNIRKHPESKIGKLAISHMREFPLLCPCGHMDTGCTDMRGLKWLKNNPRFKLDHQTADNEFVSCVPVCSIWMVGWDTAMHTYNNDPYDWRKEGKLIFFSNNLQ